MLSLKTTQRWCHWDNLTLLMLWCVHAFLLLHIYNLSTTLWPYLVKRVTVSTCKWIHMCICVSVLVNNSYLHPSAGSLGREGWCLLHLHASPCLSMSSQVELPGGSVWLTGLLTSCCIADDAQWAASLLHRQYWLTVKSAELRHVIIQRHHWTMGVMQTC